MFSLLLAIIYLAFVSLGLPDSLLGSAWPIMHQDLNVPISFAGIITMIISGGTIVSSLFSARLIRKMGTGLVTAFSVLLTALALFGFSFAKSYWVLCFLAIPYGLGAGSIDAALNNYVAIHYSSRQMSWLHASWGVGVTVSPYIMSFCLTRQLGWNMGYRLVSFIQFALAIVMFTTLFLWEKVSAKSEEKEIRPKVLTFTQTLSLPGVPFILIAFLSLCAVEGSAGLWSSSYMVEFRGVDPEVAARFTGLYFLGETIGRFLNGFVADKFGDRVMIRVGAIVVLVGVVMIAVPLATNFMALCGLVVLGFGVAPVYPCIIHATPGNFGKENSQALMGVQMAFAYAGTTFMPPLFGLIAQYVNIGFYPLFLSIFGLLLLVLTEVMNRTLDRVAKR